MSDYSDRWKRNEDSRRFATKDGQSWSDDDDMDILENWILCGPAARDEPSVARRLGRTIEACRNRAHMIRVELGIAEDRDDYVTTTTTKTTTTTTETTITRRPAWMDEDSLPDWYRY